MYRKLGLILIVVSAITALFFYFWEDEKIESTRFIDRLPEADIIGRADVLELATELMPTLYYYKIPVREFVSPEFFLSQGKAYGIDFQKQLYFLVLKSKVKLRIGGRSFQLMIAVKYRQGFLQLEVFLIFEIVLFLVRKFI